MFSKIVINYATAVLAMSHLATAAPQIMPRQSTPSLSLTSQLLIADTAADRYQLLPNDEDFVFDFNKSTIPMANRKTFPALVGTGGSMAVAEVGPCGMAALHIHPRSAELFVLTSGRVLVEMIPEVGVFNANHTQRVIRTELLPNMMTVFPMGSFHVQMNPDCAPASAVAAFMSEDPGVGFIAQQTFAMNDSFIAPTFGGSIAGEDIETFRKAIPQTAIFVVEECLKKCGLKKRGM